AAHRSPRAALLRREARDLAAARPSVGDRDQGQQAALMVPGRSLQAYICGYVRIVSDNLLAFYDGTPSQCALRSCGEELPPLAVDPDLHLRRFDGLSHRALDPLSHPFLFHPD